MRSSLTLVKTVSQSAVPLIGSKTNMFRSSDSWVEISLTDEAVPVFGKMIKNLINMDWFLHEIRYCSPINEHNKPETSISVYDS